MGRDKLLLEVGGMPLLHRVHDVLAGRCAEVILVGGGPARLEGVRQVRDERSGGQGPLAGIEAGLAAAEYQPVFVAAADLPFLPA
jgi:molybdenum cofactor guanylyltransferase